MTAELLTSSAQILDEISTAFEASHYGDEAVEWRYEIPRDDIERLWLLRTMVMRYEAAVRTVRTRVDGAIADLLGVGGGARFGDEWIRYSAPSDPVLTPRGVEWLSTLSTDDVLRVLPSPRTFRKTGLAAVLSRSYPDLKPAEIVAGVEGSLWVDRRGEKDPTISTTPIDKAPKYAQTMSSGELRRPST